jgi:hypothetical protein
MSAYLLKPGDTLTFRGQEIGIVMQIRSTRDAFNMETHSIDVINKPATQKPIAKTVNCVFGVPGWKKQYRGNLVGNIRIRYRTEGYATIYVRDPYRIREYLLEVDGEYVTHGQEIAQNQRTTPRTK